MPEGRPSLLARRTLYREFFAARRDLHSACTNLNQLAHMGNQRREVPTGGWATLGQPLHGPFGDFTGGTGLSDQQ